MPMRSLGRCEQWWRHIIYFILFIYLFIYFEGEGSRNLLGRKCKKKIKNARKASKNVPF